MKALGNYLLRTCVHAIVMLSLLSMCALFVPPLAYIICGAPMGLVTLRKGWVTGIQVAAGSLLLITLMAAALGLSPAAPIAVMIFVWLPIIACSGLLRSTQSQAVMLIGAAIIGIFSNIFVYLTLESIQAQWQTWFDAMKEYATSAQAVQQLDQAHQFISPMLSAIIPASFIVSMIITMLLARWWQSALFRPGGFRLEFYRIRLPRSLAIGTLAGLLVLLLAYDSVTVAVRDCVIMMLVLYVFQGLSIVHGYVFSFDASRGWLFGLYAMFFVLPQAALLLVTSVGLMYTCIYNPKTASSGDNNA